MNKVGNCESLDEFVTYLNQTHKTIKFTPEIWPHGHESLDGFVTYLNQTHKTIKFTAETSTTQVNFLDEMVTTYGDNKLTTSLYTKPTDSLFWLWG